jgi:hypothetical protein
MDYSNMEYELARTVLPAGRPTARNSFCLVDRRDCLLLHRHRHLLGGEGRIRPGLAAASSFSGQSGEFCRTALPRRDRRTRETVAAMKQPSRKSKPGKSARKRRLPRGCVRYSQVKGKILDFVELWVSSDYRCISIRFQDKTDFCVEIDPCIGLAFNAMHSDWKTGDQRVLKRWPSVRSQGS